MQSLSLWAGGVVDADGRRSAEMFALRGDVSRSYLLGVSGCRITVLHSDVFQVVLGNDIVGESLFMGMAP